MSTLHASLRVFLVAACSGGLHAQVPMHDFQGGTTLQGYGSQACAAGDVNGDGYADVAIAAPDINGPGPGRVEIRSGRDGTLLKELHGSAPGDGFGSHIAPLGDIDGDGQQELIVASGHRKVVDVLSGQSFAVIHHLQLGPGPAVMGSGLADLGDLDGDGLSDFSISGDFGDASGFVAILSGADAHLLLLMQGSGPGDLFGSNVSGAGDINGDGYPDFMVRHNESDIYFNGVLSFFSGRNGALLAKLGGGAIGTGMGAVGDLDGDGCDEVILGAPQNTNIHAMGNGFAIVWSWKLGAPLFEFNGAHWLSAFGSRAGSLGDVNGDGLPDVFVTSPGYYSLPDIGQVFVYSGADGSQLFSVEGTLDAPLGATAAAAGDLNGDGRTDLIAGASSSSTLFAGHDGYIALYVVSPPFLWLGEGLAGTLPAPILYAEGALQPAASTMLGLHGALPGSLPLLIGGPDALHVPFKGGTLVPSAAAVVPWGVVDPFGDAVLSFPWPAGMPAGASLFLQTWLADPGTPQGFAASNALQAQVP